MAAESDAQMPEQEDGMISVVLSPTQLAAVLENASIDETSTRSNRIWGAVGMAGGAVELVLSAGLLIDPDPTVSKVVGAIGLVHGTDIYFTSWEQLRTGRAHTPLISEAVRSLAVSLGMDPQQAAVASVMVDIMVPMGVAGAAARSQALFRVVRVAAVRRGFVSLEVEEQLFDFPNKPSASAHALRDHCGKTLTEMLERFKIKPSLEATGSFRTVAEAEQAVSQILRSNKQVIQRWVTSAAGKPLRLSMKFAEGIGDGVLNPATNTVTPGAVYVSQSIKTVTVVLAKTNLNGRTWYVLTAFPDIMRDLGLLPM